MGGLWQDVIYLGFWDDCGIRKMDRILVLHEAEWDSLYIGLHSELIWFINLLE